MIVGGSQERIKLNHEIERLGGISDFETANEYTFSTIDIIPEKISEAARILSLLLFDDAFNEDKLEIEYKAILNEIAEATDDPKDKISETLTKSLFRQHPVRNPICGSKKTIAQITTADLKATHRKQYIPSNMILIFTGKLIGAYVAIALSHFKDKGKQSSASKIFRQPENSKPRKEKILRTAGISQAYLCFGLRTSPAHNQDSITLDLINAILSNGESSRLFVELREKRALTYGFDSENMCGIDYGYFSIVCVAKPKYIVQTREIIKKELEGIKNNPVASDELEKSKNLLLSDILRLMDDPIESVRTIAVKEILFSNEKALANYTKIIKTLTKEDILSTANKYFKEDNYSTVTLLPR